MRSGTESKLAKILRTLSNKDSIRILGFAQRGFEGTTDTHKRLGLSVKRYYHRLSGLMDAGLVRKMNNMYQVTPLGSIVWETLERRVVWAIENVRPLSIMETLRASGNVDEEAWKIVIADVLGDQFANSLRNSAKVVTTYEDLVDVSIKLMERAVDTIYLASRYGDIRAIEAGWSALKRGVKLRVIDGSRFSATRMKIIAILIRHPKYAKIMYDLWHSDNVQVRYRDIPYSFLVVDSRDCCVEILNPTTIEEGCMGEFFAAVQLDETKSISMKLVETFTSLWKEGEKDDPVASITEDLMRKLKE